MEKQILLANLVKEIIDTIKIKNIDIESLAFDLGLETREFIDNLFTREKSFLFYLQTLSLVERWEG